MLVDLFPRMHRRFSSLPVLGSALEGFAGFLARKGYPRDAIRRHLTTSVQIDQRLRKRGCSRMARLTRARLKACAPPPGRSQDDLYVASTVRQMESYLDERRLIPPIKRRQSRVGTKLDEYAAYLLQVRGLARSTIGYHLHTSAEFFEHLEERGGLSHLSRLRSDDIETFIRRVGPRMTRDSLQHVVGHVRSLLRYLATRGEVPCDLDSQIDTPRVFRGDKLPRSLPWEVVCALLKSVDRSTPMGARDYAMLLMMTTYGLRASDIVGLKLDDIEWRSRRISFVQRKTTAPLVLPLTNDVGDSIAKYLRRGRPRVALREVFVRHRAPAGALKPTAVSEVFQSRSRQSGLSIPFQGCHCLRHSFAVHLLRQGVSLKTIGDVLGQRSTESTCTYLRLDVEDLRTVPLDLPAAIHCRQHT